MILEALRVISTALQDAGYGVNVKIAALTLDGGDSAPPDVVTFLEASSSDMLASGILMASGGTTFPVLGVTQHGPISGDAALHGPPVLEYTGDLAVWYLTDNTAAGAAYQDALYTMRAVKQCLTSLLLPANEADKTRGTVSIQQIESVTALPVFQEIDKVQVTAALQLAVRIRDQGLT